MRLSERMKLCEGLFTNGHSVSAALGECLYRTTGVMCSDIVHVSLLFVFYVTPSLLW